MEQIHVNQEKAAAAGLAVSSLCPTPSFSNSIRTIQAQTRQRLSSLSVLRICFLISGFEGRAVLIDGQRTAQPGTTLSPLLKDLHPTTVQTSEQAS